MNSSLCAVPDRKLTQQDTRADREPGRRWLDGPTVNRSLRTRCELLGESNMQMLFSVCAKWIDGADRSRERDSASLGHNRATNFGELAEKAEESVSYVAEMQEPY